MNKLFTANAWEDYLYWQHTDKKVVKKINELIRDIERNGNDGIGRPEALKHELSGFWSRRIIDRHRLIYRLDQDNLCIIACRGHYE